MFEVDQVELGGWPYFLADSHAPGLGAPRGMKMGFRATDVVDGGDKVDAEGSVGDGILCNQMLCPERSVRLGSANEGSIV